MQRVDGNRVGQCRGWIKLLEVQQADRSGRDAFARDEAESSARQKNWEPFPRPVSRNPIVIEDCSRLIKLTHWKEVHPRPYEASGIQTRRRRAEPKK